MRKSLGIALGFAFSCWSVGGALAADEPLSACFGATGAYLTTNTNSDSGRTVGRSLVVLTDGGHVFTSDSNEGGSGVFAPFTNGGGTWRCVSDESGRFHIQATVLDFTLATAAFPDQKIARLDYDATWDESAGSLSADVLLYFLPLDADPFDKAMLKDAIRNRVEGSRVPAP